MAYLAFNGFLEVFDVSGGVVDEFIAENVVSSEKFPSLGR
jgi:hypothetical protein